MKSFCLLPLNKVVFYLSMSLCLLLLTQTAGAHFLIDPDSRIANSSLILRQDISTADGKVFTGKYHYSKMLENIGAVGALLFIKDKGPISPLMAVFSSIVQSDDIPSDELPTGQRDPSADTTGPTGSEDYIMFGIMALLVFALGLVVLRAFGVTARKDR